MIKDSIKAEIFFDLMNGLSDNHEEQAILDKVLPMYLRKLNCFVAIVLRPDGEQWTVQQCLPLAMQRNRQGQNFLQQLLPQLQGIPTDMQELAGDRFRVYAYPLSSYGVLLLGRKQPFGKLIKHELTGMIALLGKTLEQSLARKQKEQWEKQLQQERQLFRTIIDNIPIHIYAKDAQGRRILSNQAEVQFLGANSEAELLGKTDGDIFREDAARQADAEDREVIQDGTPILDREVDIYNPQHQRRWGLISKIPLPRLDDAANGMVGITIDITARKDIEQQILRKKEFLRGIARATDELLINPNLDDAIDRSLLMLRDALRTDRTFLFRNQYEDDTMVSTSHVVGWRSGEKSPRRNMPELQQIPISKLSDALKPMERRELFWSKVKDLANYISLKPYLQQSQIDNLLLIPISHRDRFWGFFGFADYTDKKLWSRDELALLMSFSNSMAKALEITQQSQELRDMAKFPMENPDPVVRVDRLGRVLLKNGQARVLEKAEFSNPNIRNEWELYTTISRQVSEQQPSFLIELNSEGQTYLGTARLSETRQYINIFFSNISQQKAFEQEIIASNQQLKLFRSLIDNSSDAVQVSLEDGRLFYVNKVASERLGIKQEEASQYYVQDIETIFKNPGSWQQHVAELKRKNSLYIQGENTHQATGRTFPVEVIVKYIRIGDTGFVIANSRDITERQQQEAKLRQQEEKYRNIISNMHSGLLEIDTQGIIRYCNQSFCQMAGYEEAEIRGQYANHFIPITADPAFAKKNHLHFLGDLPRSTELLTENKRGEQKWWLFSSAPNFNDQGENTGFIGICLDITRQKKLEEDLESALHRAQEGSRAKEQFLANMSHEIRTPLNGILGMIRELNQDELPERQRKYLGAAQRASQHLLSIVNNILDISKIEAGELELHERPLSVKEMLDDIRTMIEPQARQKNIDFRLQYEVADSEQVIGDETRIRQILLNILGNAIKFTNLGHVTLICRSKRPHSLSAEELANFDLSYGARLKEERYHGKTFLNFRIQDTGIGMGQSYLEKLFQKFQQEDTSISRRFGGTGLGMVISKKLVELMGGVIQVNSNKGSGTLVDIYLPLAPAEPPTFEYEDSRNDHNILRGLRVLLVEDNHLNRLVATKTLQRLHMQPTVAVNGQKAVEKIKENKYDIVLMDIQMPVMNGKEASRYIRQRLKLDIPIIALSASALKSEIEDCLQSGINDYVTKPFQEKDLVDSIIKQINNKNPEMRTGKTKQSEESTLYNLQTLEELSAGDEQMKLEILQAFVDSVPVDLQRLEQAQQQEDLETIQAVLHTLKPSLSYVGIEHLIPLIHDIRSAQDWDSLQQHCASSLQQIITTTREAAHQIAKRELMTS